MRFVVQREGSAHLRDRLTLRLLRNKHTAATADQLIAITATVSPKHISGVWWEFAGIFVMV